MPHFTRRIDRLRWRIVAARQEAAAPLVVEADFRVVYVRTPLQFLALCVRSPSGIVVNTVVRAGSMASSQGDVVLTRRRLQHAGPCWSTTCPRCLWTLLTQLKLPRHIKASAADETLYVRVPPVYTPCIIHTRVMMSLHHQKAKPCRSRSTTVTAQSKVWSLH